MPHKNSAKKYRARVGHPLSSSAGGRGSGKTRPDQRGKAKRKKR